MKLTKEIIIKRIDELESMVEQVLGTKNQGSINEGLYIKLETASHSLIDKIYTSQNPYYLKFSELRADSGSYRRVENVHSIKAILENIKFDIENGWYESIQSLISAEIFIDYLDMANHLLDEKFHDAAAVIIGSTLEGHLRKLCIKNNIQINIIKNDGRNYPKKADAMNTELVKANVYNGLEGKNITTRLDLRNKAARGQYSNYQAGHVIMMHREVSDFIIKHS